MRSDHVPSHGTSHDHSHGDGSGAVFPDAGHDHHACESGLLTFAEARCTARGLTLSPQRRRVLGALAESHAPVGAYELIDRLAEEGSRPAPISVYRALAFLTEAGLAHRIERLNAYVACARTHGEDGALVFLICDACGQVGEVAASEVGFDVGRLAGRAGFAPRTATLEITGLCAACAAKPGAGSAAPGGS